MSATLPPSSPPSSPRAPKDASRSESSSVTAREGVPLDLHAELAQLVGALPIATCLLDKSGLVVSHNRAFAELLQRVGESIDGEPFLGWIGRASEREGFGRAFMGLRDRDVGTGFALDVGLVPRLGPPASCRLRAIKLQGGTVGLSCLPNVADAGNAETELGLAVTRGLDALDQGVLFVDADARIVHSNPAGTKMLGDGVIGRNLLELAEGATTSTLTRALALARGGSWQGELSLRRLDGEPLPVEMSIAAGSGTAVVLLRDLRERRRREFEERLVAQVDRALVSSADPRQSVSAACAALGSAVGATRIVVLARTGGQWTRWELQGGTVTRALELPAAPPEAWESTRGAEEIELGDAHVRAAFGLLPDLRAALRVVLRGPSGAVGYLLLARAQPGAWDPRDRALAAAIAAQIGLGLESGLLTLATRELAAYQAMVLDQATVVIDTLDADGRVVTWNRASEQLLQTTADAAMGKKLGIEVGVATDAARWAELWATLLRDGVVAREIVLGAAGGGEVPLHVEGRLLRDGDEVRGAVLVGLDLRDRRALERQILRSQKLAAVGLLAAGIAHEINNPLSGVVGYSKLLLERPLQPEIRERVEKIAQSGERCRKIVEGVLLFSRQQDGGVRRQVDLRALLDRVLAIGEYQWRMHNVRIIRELDEPASVMADADQIEQVVLNLLSNAVDAMPRGGAVRLRLAAPPGGGASLTVADEGHGIPEEIQARIFDPFFSTKEIGKGTGLGLAISYGIVHDHGGDIVVDSAPGRGAAFTVTLPASGTPEGQGR